MTELVGLRARLADGPAVLATFVIVPRIEIVEIAALAGFDAVLLDQEHGPLGPADLPALIAAARGAGIHAVVRVAEGRAKQIESALDAGADGVLVPHVSTRAAAVAAVAASRFAPDGTRGVNPYVRAGAYGSDPRAFIGRANAAAACMVMIEGADGLAAAPEIVSTPGLDAVFVGPFDLSAALGRPGETEHADVVGGVLDIARTAREHGVAAGVFAPTPAAARAWLERGLQLVALGVDTALAREGFRRAVDDARG